MRKVALIMFVSLASVGYGRRMQIPAARWHRSRERMKTPLALDAISSPQADARLLQVFASMLSTLKPRAAFNLSGQRGCPSAGGCLTKSKHSADSLSPLVGHRSFESRERIRMCDELTPRAHLLQKESSSGFCLDVAAIAKWIAQMLTVFAAFCALLMASPDAVHADESLPAAAITRQGSPVVREVVDILDKFYLDRTFNGVDLKQVKRELDEGRPLSDEEALDKSVKLVQSLDDKFTRIFTPGEVRRSQISKMDMTGVGLDFIVDPENGDVTVGSVPKPDTPAGKKGIQIGEKVTMLNGKSTRGMFAPELIKSIEEGGDTVKLKVIPANGPIVTLVEREYELTKKVVPEVVSPVTYKMYDPKDGSGKTGYLRVYQMTAQAKTYAREAVKNLEASGASRLVLDLRNNEGGVLDGALSIAGMFLKKSVVLKVTDKDSTKVPLYAKEESILTKLPLEVWINEKSASSAEVLAGALRDNCRATLVGTKTRGKGTAQGVFGLSNGGSLSLTYATWSTPAGLEVNNEGVKPDIEREFLSSFWGPKLVDQDLKTAGEDFALDTLKACQPPPA